MLAGDAERALPFTEHALNAELDPERVSEVVAARAVYGTAERAQSRRRRHRRTHPQTLPLQTTSQDQRHWISRTRPKTSTTRHRLHFAHEVQHTFH